MKLPWKSVVLALGLASALTIAPGSAQAQSKQGTNVGQLVSGLINVNIGAVELNIGNITVADLVNVTDVLNNNNINALDNVLNQSPILSNNSDILTNLLRDANILNDNQVVVGVLNGGLFAIQTLP